MTSSLFNLSFAFVCAAVTTFCAIWLLRPLAHRWQLLDRPDRRKKHTGEIPLVGGLAIFIGVAVAVIVSLPLGTYLIGPFAASLLIVATGAVDDRVALGVRTRFLLQVVAALIMIESTGLTIESLGDLVGLGEIKLGVLAVPFTVISVVGVINAFNMIDGIDGLASTACLVSLLVLALVLGDLGRGEMVLIVSLAAGAMAFTLFNLSVFGKSKKVFLGDAGSMLIGFALCWLVIKMTQDTQASMAPAAALWVVGLPLIDMWAVMTLRLATRVSPFVSRRDHFHHILLAAGFSDRMALGILLALALTFGLSALLSTSLAIPEAAMFCTFLVVLVLRIVLIVKPRAPFYRMWRLSRNAYPRVTPGAHYGQSWRAAGGSAKPAATVEKTGPR